MYERAVDEAATHLHELEASAREQLALAALALGLAIAATQAWASFAMPLFLGGVGVGALGLRALVRHWELLDLLADERDAYAIPAVRRHAMREASMDRRQLLSAQIRAVLAQPRLGDDLRAIGVADELDELACQLADEELLLAPLSGIACKRLLDDPMDSPLYDPCARSAELRARIRDVRSGFDRRPLAA